MVTNSQTGDGRWDDGDGDDLTVIQTAVFRYLRSRVCQSLGDNLEGKPVWDVQHERIKQRRLKRNSKRNVVAHSRKRIKYITGNNKSIQNDPIIEPFSEEEPVLLPGDSIVLLCSTESNDSSTCVVYINTFWRWERSMRINQLLIFHNDGLKGELYEDVPHIIEIDEVPTLISRNKSSTDLSHSSSSCSTKGNLEDGTPYYVYHMLLYSDDFVPRSLLFPTGSVGGFYMLPINMSRSRRRKSSSVRTISLTPTGISSRFVFDYIIPDIVNGMTKGISSIDIYNNKCRIFLEVVGYVGDYPE